MISKLGPKRTRGRGSFLDLRRYLELDKEGQLREDLLESWSGNVASHVTADLEMQRMATQGRVEDPVLHLILSWRPGEVIDQQVARDAIDATLQSLDAEHHQWFAALHHDEDDRRYHLHVALSRIDPITLNALDLWRCNAKLARAAEWVERAYGCLVDRRMAWREVLPEIELGMSLAEAGEYVEQRMPEGVRVAPEGAEQKEMDAARRAGYSWVTLVAREAVPAALAAANRDEATWADVHAALETYGVHFVRAGSGLRILGPEIGQHVKASRVGVVFRDMVEKLGPYTPCAIEVLATEERFAVAREALSEASSWNELRERLGHVNLLIEKRGLGGRLYPQSGEKGIPIGRLGWSMPRLEKRLGKYAEVDTGRQERDDIRRDEGILERLALIAAEPTIVLERLHAHHSVWSNVEIELEVGRIVGLARKELLGGYTNETKRIVHAVIGQSHFLGTETLVPDLTSAKYKNAKKKDDAPRVWMSTPEIMACERAAFASFAAVAARGRDLSLRAPSAELDEQQQEAYRHLADGSSDVRLVTGIAGAGKSRLLRDVCAAHREYGDTVIGVAVAGSAALVLGHEANIPALTLAKLLYDLDKGRHKLDERTVVLVDEASMLGTADAGRLAQHVQMAHARLYLLGDVQQHESVARGPLLADLVERYGAADLTKTRRAQEQWLRDVGMDLRAGRVTRALDTLRGRGCIEEFESNEAAMAPLVERYAADCRVGRSALLIATTRADVATLNELAREALRDSLGEERTYVTNYGKRAFAVGDRVVTREPYRVVGAVNGDTWVVRGHEGQSEEQHRLTLCRDRDGAVVSWDVEARPAIDHGHAITSYRSQGRTVAASYILVTQADAQRGLYVDVTRAQETVFIAYGREDIVDFGQLLDIGARDRAKRTVASLQSYLAEQAARRKARLGRSEVEMEQRPNGEVRDAQYAGVLITGREGPWGAHAAVENFAQAIEKTHVGHLFTAKIVDGELHLSHRLNTIVDRGLSIKSQQASEFDIRAMMGLVVEKKWTTIDIHGDAQSVQEVMQAAHERGIDVLRDGELQKREPAFEQHADPSIGKIDVVDDYDDDHQARKGPRRGR